MNPYLSTLALSAMPAIGSYIGGLLSEFIPPSKGNLSLTLHAAAGIILSVVGVELMPQMLAADPPWLIFLAFVMGGGFFILMRRGINYFQKHTNKSEKQSSAWVIFLAVGVDLFSDGLMVGTSSTIAFSLALMVAIGHIAILNQLCHGPSPPTPLPERERGARNVTNHLGLLYPG